MADRNEGETYVDEMINVIQENNLMLMCAVMTTHTVIQAFVCCEVVYFKSDYLHSVIEPAVISCLCR